MRNPSIVNANVLRNFFCKTLEELEMYLKEDDVSVRKIHVNSIDMYYEIDTYNCKYE